jgi:hypothetical protein
VEVELLALDPAEEPARAAPAKKPVARPDGQAKKAPEGLGQENARLQIQVRGLAMQLSDAQMLIVERDEEIERLREQLEMAKAALQRALSGQ